MKELCHSGVLNKFYTNSFSFSNLLIKPLGELENNIQIKHYGKSQEASSFIPRLEDEALYGQNYDQREIFI